MNNEKLLKLAGFNSSDYIVDKSGKISETSFLQEDDMLQLLEYYEMCESILDNVVNGSYEIIACNGLADYPYCIVKVNGDVIGFTEEDRLCGIHFELVTGNFDCSNGGINALNCNSNCGIGYGFWCLAETIHGDLLADNNNLQNLNGMCEVRGNVYVRGNKNLRAIKEGYEGFMPNDSLVPIHRIYADKYIAKYNRIF